MKDPYLDPTAESSRLLSEARKYGALVVAVDFDNTLYDYHGEGHTYPALSKLVRDAYEQGHQVIIFTANGDIPMVRDRLAEDGIPHDGINTDPNFFPSDTRKPFFNILLDDRAGLPHAYASLRRVVDTLNKHKE